MWNTFGTNRKRIYAIATLLFLSISGYVKADGFGWHITEIDFKAFESFFKEANIERRNAVITELNDYYLLEMVVESERSLHKELIKKVFNSKMDYNLLSFEEAGAVDRIIVFLFSPESPLSEFGSEDQGFYVPVYCMQDLLKASNKQTKVLNLFKEGRRFGTSQPIECDKETFDLKKIINGLTDKKLTNEQKKKIAKIQANRQVSQKVPCYYSYIILSPEEVVQLALELNVIKKQVNFAHDEECYFTNFYDAVNASAKRKTGLFLNTTD